jgi:hypothetical protein
MAVEADQTPRVINEPITDENKSDSRTESNIPAGSSSSNIDVAKMVEKIISEMVDYWKKTTITEVN